MRTLISVEKFRTEARRNHKPSAPVFRVSLDAPADVDGASRTKRFCFSDGSVDRMGDTVSPYGWDLDDFMRNPVALWAHDSLQPPIGRASAVRVEGSRLMGNIEFVPAATYAFADTIFRLVEGRFINAVSVGFLPTKYSFVENDPDRGWGIDFEEQVLLEISLCPVPANPNALGAARSKGIDTRPLSRWAARTLDTGGSAILSRAALCRLRVAAREPQRTGVGSRAGDLARAAALRERILGDSSPAAMRQVHLARAAAVRRKIYSEPGPDYAAMKVQLDGQEELRRRDRAAAIDRMDAMIQW